METIIGLLFILLPVIFRLIGKKLEDAGKNDTARKILEMFEEEMSVDAENAYETEAEAEAEPVMLMPAESPAPKPVPVVKPVPVSKPFKETKTTSPVLQEEIRKKPAEKIDPKKLIIYSEIMTPKYKE